MEILYVILTSLFYILLYLLYRWYITKSDSKSKKNADKNKKRKKL